MLCQQYLQEQSNSAVYIGYCVCVCVTWLSCSNLTVNEVSSHYTTNWPTTTFRSRFRSLAGRRTTRTTLSGSAVRILVVISAIGSRLACRVGELVSGNVKLIHLVRAHRELTLLLGHKAAWLG